VASEKPQGQPSADERKNGKSSNGISEKERAAAARAIGDIFSITDEDVEYALPEVKLKGDSGDIRARYNMLTPELVAVALYEARGFESIAARKLGCTVRVVRKFVAKYEICAVASEEAEHMLLDFAEAKLLQKIKAGDIASIIFYLKTKGKKRGYNERELVTKNVDQKDADEVMEEAKRKEEELSERLATMQARMNYKGDIDLEAEKQQAEVQEAQNGEE
jgi:hypothetical protein